MARARNAVLILVVVVAIGGAALYWKYEPTFGLRGYSYRSQDGKTYLVVVNDGLSENYRAVVDGKDWSYPLDRPGPITPGTHELDQIQFIVRPGHVFHFNYWGP